MQITNDNIYVLITLGMLGTFLLVSAFILFSVRNQNRLLKQRQRFQQAEIVHQKELLRAIIESEEAERKRIGQDLHDDVGHGFLLDARGCFYRRNRSDFLYHVDVKHGCVDGCGSDLYVFSIFRRRKTSLVHYARSSRHSGPAPCCRPLH